MSLCDKKETLLQDINHEKTYSEANQSNTATHIKQLLLTNNLPIGARWLSGRVSNSLLRDRLFKPHRRHCFMFLSKTFYSLLRPK